jgi:Alginate export
VERKTHACLILCTACALLVTPAAACGGQTPTVGQDGKPATTVTLRDWTRVEMWNFFEPPSGGGTNDYDYIANRLYVAVRRSTRRYDANAALQYVQFGGLPANAVGPGPLGLGAVYFAHAGRSDSREVYLRYLNLQLKNVVPGVSIHAGRMPYASGSESTTGNPKIEVVKRQRLDARLVGEFDWSIYQRAFDGVRMDVVRPPWSAAFTAFHPTQGGFEDAAGVDMKDLTVIGGSTAFKPGRIIPGTEWQLFAIRYVDTRAVNQRPDNTGNPATRADIGINTFGTTLVSASPLCDGSQWDSMFWLAAQTGRWYEQDHRAFSVAAEAGHQWTASAWHPWLRGGYLRASGDSVEADTRHGTFFQMLPTVRRYAQSALFSQMNVSELFAQAMLRPSQSLGLRFDVHHVNLASRHDNWYVGSGATQSRGKLFGFSTRPSNGAVDLATSLEASADYTVSRRWSVNGYFSVASGGDVVRRSFAGRTMTYGYVESVVQLGR